MNKILNLKLYQFLKIIKLIFKNKNKNRLKVIFTDINSKNLI